MGFSSFKRSSQFLTLLSLSVLASIILLVIDLVSNNTNGRVLHNTPAPSDQGTLRSLGGASVIKAPADVQELINRGVVVVIGTVSKDPIYTREGPFDESGNITDHHTIPISTYEIEIERVIVDDGAVAKAPLLRLSGSPEQIRFPTDKRFLFVLNVNPDGRYGADGDWAVVRLSDDKPRNYGGAIPSYMEGSSTDSFIEEVEAAARNHKHTPVSEWPRIEYE
jgi:hypothetical protein